MAISSLIDHIANHGTDGSIVVGGNTPAPYANATLTGFVDGTGPQNASKNMAEFYNRQVFAAKHLIEAAGLTWDPANWAQMTAAYKELIDDAILANGQVFGFPEVAFAQISFADGVANAVGSSRLGAPITKTFTNTKDVPRKLLLRYDGSMELHGANSSAVGVLGYAERSINGGAYTTLAASKRTLLQCYTGGFGNESGASSGFGSEVFTVPASSSIIISVRQRLYFYFATTGPGLGIDVAYESGMWTYIFS